MIQNFFQAFLSRDARYKNFVILFFFTSYLFIGISIYKDFGISWDEPISRKNGLISLKYVLETFNVDTFPGMRQEKIIPLRQWNDKDYGVVFELPAVFLEKLFHVEDAEIYPFRHLLTFIFCFFGVIAIYRLGSRRFGDWRAGLLAALFFITSPRFFAESFYNDKDLIFTAAYVIALNSLISFYKKPTTQNALLCALFTAIAINIRIAGISLAALTLPLVVFLCLRGDYRFHKPGIPIVVYMVLLPVFTIVLWPYLWDSPLKNFAQAISNMINFRWDNELLFFGEKISSLNIPWYYTFAYIAITTPLNYLFAVAVGALTLIYNKVKSITGILTPEYDLEDLVYLILFLTPLLLAIIMKSVLYDGWRQTYFVYPPMIMLGLYGLRAFIRVINDKLGKTIARFALGAYLLSCLVPIGFILRSHPHQNTYFNFLAGKNWKYNFDVDYWGVGNWQAIKYLLKNDRSEIIRIWCGSRTPLATTLQYLPEKDRKRLVQVKKEADADFIITNYRGARHNDYEKPPWNNEVFHHIKVGNEIIISIFKNR